MVIEAVVPEVNRPYQPKGKISQDLKKMENSHLVTQQGALTNKKDKRQVVKKAPYSLAASLSQI